MTISTSLVARRDLRGRPRVRLLTTVMAVIVIVFALDQHLAVAQQQPDYIIGPRDVLTITVWEQPDLTGKFTVEPDGNFTYPLIGRVKVAGLSSHQVEDEIRGRLAKGFFKNPQVTVSVDAYQSQLVYVVGEVRQPGSYPLSGHMTLIEALARAGSTTERAGNVAVITRPRPMGLASPSATESAAAEVIRASLTHLQTGDVAENVVLRGGDTVFIPRAEVIYVLGEVRRPGTFPIDEHTTVLQAIALAGGVTERGSNKRVRIIRQVNGKPTELKPKPYDLVRPSDTVVVLERFF